MRTDETEAPRCPNCGARDPARILYGLPARTDELLRALDRGDVVLGGCLVEPARWMCRACKSRWPTDFVAPTPASPPPTERR